MIDSVTSLENLDSLKRGCRLVWSRLEDLGSLDPGSNPGSPTTDLNSIGFKLLQTRMTRIYKQKYVQCTL